MTHHHNTHPRVVATGARAETLPLFAWADSRRDNHQTIQLPRAAHVVARRFGLSPSHARAVAELAGFQLEAA